MIGEEVIAVYGDAGDGEELFEVQKLVRCKECKYYEADWCYWRDEAITADGFCSYGYREGE